MDLMRFSQSYNAASRLMTTMDELLEAAAQGLSKRNAYIRRNRAANAMPNGQMMPASSWLCSTAAASVRETPTP